MCLKKFLGGFEDATVKFIDVIAKGCGKIYEPTHLKRMYKANAKGMKLLADAAESVNVKLSFNDGTISVDNADLFSRAKDRLIYQEMLKQSNIESVLKLTYDEIKTLDAVDKKPVDENWIVRFFNSVQDVSSEDLQKIWAKLLSGEIKKSGSVSLRTMEHLKNLSSEEAKTFTEITKYALFDEEKHYFLIENLVTESKINYGALLDLEDCGLIKSQRASFSFEKSDEISSISNKNSRLVLNLTDELPFELSVFPYSSSGEELAKILCNESFDYSLNLVIKELNTLKISFEREN